MFPSRTARESYFNPGSEAHLLLCKLFDLIHPYIPVHSVSPTHIQLQLISTRSGQSHQSRQCSACSAITLGKHGSPVATLPGPLAREDFSLQL